MSVEIRHPFLRNMECPLCRRTVIVRPDPWIVYCKFCSGRPTTFADRVMHKLFRVALPKCPIHFPKIEMDEIDYPVPPPTRGYM